MVKNGKEKAYVRLAVLAVFIINQGLIIFGYDPLPFSDEQIYEGISLVALALGTLWVWYKNNNTSDVALAGQAEIERIKGARKNAN